MEDLRKLINLDLSGNKLSGIVCAAGGGGREEDGVHDDAGGGDGDDENDVFSRPINSFATKKKVEDT